MTQIVTLASTETGVTKSQRYPILEAGNVSFPRGRYAVEFGPGERRASIVLRHDLENVALIRRFVEEGVARYCCTVSSPVSSYRRMHYSIHPSQEIGWDSDDLGEPPLFTPMVIAFEARTLELSDQDDVHPIWEGRTIEIARGSRLAVGPVVRLKPTLLHLLRIDEDINLRDGTFQVDAESQPFQFVVKVSVDLHRYLQYGPRDNIRGHVMTNVVTACLALLQRDFSDDGGQEEDGWQSDRNLMALADYLEENDVPHWTEVDDFRPEEVATRLYPHLVEDVSKGGPDG